MAIVTMTTREEYEAHLGDPNYWIDPFYPGAEAGLVEHSRACPHYDEKVHGREICGGYADCLGWNDPRRETVVDAPTGVYGTNKAGESGYFAGYCHGPCEPLYMQRTHIGLVLELREMNGYDDSDFYAVVWDEKANRPARVEYASTRGWTYPNGASVDAPPEVRAAYEDFLARERQLAEETRAAAVAKVHAEAEAAAAAVNELVGKTVRVRRGFGQKLPKGLVGKVTRTAMSKFVQGQWRVCIAPAGGGQYWTTSTNVTVA